MESVLFDMYSYRNASVLLNILAIRLKHKDCHDNNFVVTGWNTVVITTIFAATNDVKNYHEDFLFPFLMQPIN